jgi:hypothetical protein
VRCDVAWQLLRLAGKEAAIVTVIEELRQAPEFEQAVAEARLAGDENGDPLEDEPARLTAPPRGRIGRRVLLAAIALALGVGAGVAVADSIGGWGAVGMGAFAATFSGAVLFLVEVAVFNRM